MLESPSFIFSDVSYVVRVPGSVAQWLVGRLLWPVRADECCRACCAEPQSPRIKWCVFACLVVSYDFKYVVVFVFVLFSFLAMSMCLCVSGNHGDKIFCILYKYLCWGLNLKVSI